MVRLFKHGTSLLKSILVGMSLSISSNKVIMGNILGTLGIFKSDLNISKTQLILLNNLLGVSIGSIGMLLSSVKVQNISFQLLLHSNSLRFALSFTLNGNLHVFIDQTRDFLIVYLIFGFIYILIDVILIIA